MANRSSWVLCLKLAMLASRRRRRVVGSGGVVVVVVVVGREQLPAKRTARTDLLRQRSSVTQSQQLASCSTRTMEGKKQVNGASPGTTSMRLA